MKFLALLFFSQVCFSQILLLPDQDISFQAYQERCQKDGYLCSTKFDLEKIQQAPTPQFEELLNQLDYASENFRSEFIPRVFKIAKDENISVDQVDILIKLVEQLKDFSDAQKQKQYSLLERQLHELSDLVRSEELTELPERYLVIFKKPVPLSFMKKLKPTYFKVKVSTVVYNRVINGTQYKVEGECANPRIQDAESVKKWQVASEKACGLAEQWSRVSTSTGDFVSRHKTSLITTGLIAIGVAILLNNYEVKLTF